MGAFGKLIKQLRKDARLTLNEVAGEIDLSPSFISDIENGRRGPFENEKIISLGILFKADVNQLLQVAAKERRSIDLPVRGDPTYNKLAFSLLRADSTALGSEDTKKLMQNLIDALEKDKKNG